MTLNNIIELLRQYAANHAQLNGFGQGPISEYGASSDLKHAVMWVSLSPSRHSQKQMWYQLQLIFSDLVFDDQKNALEVQSDMLLVGLDTLAYLRDNPDFDFQVDDEVSIDFFTERMGDLCAGCVLSLTIRDPKPLDRCAIPLR